MTAIAKDELENIIASLKERNRKQGGQICELEKKVGILTAENAQLNQEIDLLRARCEELKQSRDYFMMREYLGTVTEKLGTGSGFCGKASKGKAPRIDYSELDLEAFAREAGIDLSEARAIADAWFKAAPEESEDSSKTVGETASSGGNAAEAVPAQPEKPAATDASGASEEAGGTVPAQHPTIGSNGKKVQPSSMKNLTKADEKLMKLFEEGAPFDVVYCIDDVYYTKEDFEKEFGAENLRKIYVNSEVDIYYSVELVVPAIQPMVHVSLKFRSGDCTRRNPHEGKPFANSLCGSSLLAYLLFEKFEMKSTWYRLESAPWISGLIDRSDMLGWCSLAVKQYFKYIWYNMIDHLNTDYFVLQMDETFDHVQFMKEKPGCTSGYYWGVRSSELEKGKLPLSVFFFDPSRAAFVPQYILDSFRGSIVCDGYIGYITLRNRNGELVVCVCWTHGRRPVIRALTGADVDKVLASASKDGEVIDRAWLDEHINSAETIRETASSLGDADRAEFLAWCVLCMIAQLFRIERELKDVTPDERLCVRKEKSAPIVDDIFSLIEELEPLKNRITNKYLQDGIRFFSNRETELRQFLTDGRIPLDNSACERQMLGLALGRNNWKYHDNGDGAFNSAVLMSLISTCRENHVSSYMYLKFLLTRMPAIVRRHRAELEERDAYEAKKKQRLEECRERWVQSGYRGDPALDLSGLGSKPGLRFLDELMVDSDQFTEFVKKETSSFNRMYADQCTKANLQDCPAAPKVLERVLKNGSKRAGAKNGLYHLDRFSQKYAELGFPNNDEEADPEKYDRGLVKGICITSAEPEHKGETLPNGRTSEESSEPDRTTPVGTQTGSPDSAVSTGCPLSAEASDVGTGSAAESKTQPHIESGAVSIDASGPEQSAEHALPFHETSADEQKSRPTDLSCPDENAMPEVPVTGCKCKDSPGTPLARLTSAGRVLAEYLTGKRAGRASKPGGLRAGPACAAP